MVPLRFIRALYCVDSSFAPLRGAAADCARLPARRRRLTAVRSGPSGPVPRQRIRRSPLPAGADCRRPSQRRTSPTTPTSPPCRNLERTLDRAQAAYGSHPALPIYSTEFGFQTNPPEAIARAIDPVKAALYMNWSEYISWRNPRMRSYDQYLLTDPANANSLSGFATGLELVKPHTEGHVLTPTGCRCTCRCRRPRAGHPIEVWGCVRPAHYAQLETHSAAARADPVPPELRHEVHDPEDDADHRPELLLRHADELRPQRHRAARMVLSARADDLQPRGNVTVS